MRISDWSSDVCSSDLEADIVISCVGTDDDLTAITLGQDGAFGTMKPGSLFIDHTTVSARIARQLFVEGESRGIFFVDAPVSGGQAGAEKGTLSIMCGGADEAVAAARLVMRSEKHRSGHVRSEEGRVGKECGNTCRSRWCAQH